MIQVTCIALRLRLQKTYFRPTGRSCSRHDLKQQIPSEFLVGHANPDLLTMRRRNHAAARITRNKPCLLLVRQHHTSSKRHTQRRIKEQHNKRKQVPFVQVALLFMLVILHCKAKQQWGSMLASLSVTKPIYLVLDFLRV